MALFEIIYRAECFICGAIGTRAETTWPTDYRSRAEHWLPAGWRVRNYSGQEPVCPTCRPPLDQFDADSEAWREKERKADDANRRARYAEESATRKAWCDANPRPPYPDLRNAKAVKAAMDLLGIEPPNANQTED